MFTGKQLLTFLKSSLRRMDCMILTMNSLRFVETSVTIHHPTQHKIPEDLNLQQQCCENFKSHWSIENEVVDMGLVRPLATSTILATLSGTAARMALPYLGTLHTCHSSILFRCSLFSHSLNYHFLLKS